MNQSIISSIQSFFRDSSPKVDARREIFDFNNLLLIAFIVDLTAPFLVWKGFLPASIRWLSHLSLAIIVAVAYARMMAFDHVPLAIWLIAAISLITLTTAMIQSQGVLETLWGWWRFFEFPLVGIYVYLSPKWPDKFPEWVIKGGVWILGFEVMVQVVQYLTGQPIGDHLAGTFGHFGVGPLMLFLMVMLCLALGRWIHSGAWKYLTLVLLLSMVSSVLGALRIFPFTVVALGMLSIGAYAVLKGQLLKLAIYSAVFAGVIVSFVFAFNTLVPSKYTNPFNQLLQADTLIKYFNRFQENTYSESQGYDVGRNYALSYGWETISASTDTLIFGQGIGARGESTTLGTSGLGFAEEGIGQQTRTSLLVLMQEQGLMGLIATGLFIVWVVWRNVMDIRQFPQSDVNQFRFALMIFSVFWPLWLWYKTVLGFRVPMLIYWVLLGYVLYEARQSRSEASISIIESKTINA